MVRVLKNDTLEDDFEILSLVSSASRLLLLEASFFLALPLPSCLICYWIGTVNGNCWRLECHVLQVAYMVDFSTSTSGAGVSTRAKGAKVTYASR